eukprot:TRINITY_DN5409_c0_g1_i2.p1 TRINITY_DN5409_c0_g1~~TRINITY_DN5409_c0_g1_i2.p1  ORF type:complete len:290 (-),score=46.90 TRINITY_DN5409_c0_g1_i2:48-917(-)
MEQFLTDEQRDQLVKKLEVDGYVTLPFKLPPELTKEVSEAILKLKDPQKESQKFSDIVTLDPAFRKLMLYKPALQLSYDVFGPMFHLCQSNFFTRKKDSDTNDVFKSWSPWHADGPRPAQFPKFKDGSMGLHYLKFGYFLSDLTHGTGGSLEVVRGSHLRPELDNKGDAFDINEYKQDLLKFDVEAGTVIAFHQAQWHFAGPNLSDVERINCYLSYCPTWMRPIDRDFPSEEHLKKLGTLSAVERWLLAEPREPIRWYLPTTDDQKRLSGYARTSGSKENTFLIHEHKM